MAEIRLHLDEADGGLPTVCMRCGEPATVGKSRRMSWCPPWVGVLILVGLVPYVIVALILTKRTLVQAPFCDQHKGHWLKRMLIGLGTFLGVAIVGVGSFVLLVSTPRHGGENP